MYRERQRRYRRKFGAIEKITCEEYLKIAHMKFWDFQGMNILVILRSWNSPRIQCSELLFSVAHIHCEHPSRHPRHYFVYFLCQVQWRFSVNDYNMHLKAILHSASVCVQGLLFCFPYLHFLFCFVTSCLYCIVFYSIAWCTLRCAFFPRKPWHFWLYLYRLWSKSTPLTNL